MTENSNQEDQPPGAILQLKRRRSPSTSGTNSGNNNSGSGNSSNNSPKSSGETPQPPAEDVPLVLLPTDRFSEMDVVELESMGFSRQMVITELRAANGDKTKATSGLFAKLG